MMKNAIFLAGIAHFGILIASATVPFALNWKESFKSLPPLLRQLFWVYGFFIVFMIVAFGVISLVHAETLARAETPLARTVSGLIAAFWFARLMVQFFVFDARPYLVNWIYRIGYHGLTVVFMYLVIVFTYAACHTAL
jgi:hypothetical protein